MSSAILMAHGIDDSEPPRHTLTEPGPALPHARSLRRKLVRTFGLTLATVGFVVAAALVGLQLRVSHQQLQSTRQQSERALESKGRLLVTHQAVAMRAFVADNSVMDVRQLIRQTLADDPDLLYGAFVDRDGRTWAYGDRTSSTADPGRNHGWRSLPAPPVSRTGSTSATYRQLLFADETIAEFAMSISVEGQPAGLLRYGVSLAAGRQASEAASAQVRRTMVVTLAILVGMGLVALSLGALAMRRQAARITHPLAELSRAVQAVADGRSGINVTIESGDEIEVLAKNFNTMVRSLEESHSALRHANAQLKQEMDERLKMELELRQAQKLEAVGRLASGIAHEINTPTQFVGDSIHFVREATASLQGLIRRYQAVYHDAPSGEWAVRARREIEQAEVDADLDYVVQELPSAIERSIDGLARVSTIVRSMKEFAHPGQNEISSVDLNHAISTTLTIARNEYKYVADVETSFGELPAVPCCQGEFNQAFLNILINAAHAIGDVVESSGAKGIITVRTTRENGFALVAVTDTGRGIPVGIRDRIFDPFFTTKEVGRGTGQGLPIARSVIVDKHHGQLTFETEVGKGTTFFIRLPLHRPSEVAADFACAGGEAPHG